VPSRFTIVAGMFMCVLIGVAVDTWAAPALAHFREASRRARWIGVGVTVAALAFLVDASQFNRQQWEQNFAGPPRTLARAAEFHNAPGNSAIMYVYPPANQGSLNCFEETPIPISSALRANLASEEYLREPDAGTVRRVHWSPNRIELDVTATRPATVIVNQNWNAGWRVTGGTVVERDGLLAATVPAGHQTLVFRFLPTSVLAGAGVTVFAALGAVTLVIYDRRRRRLAGTL